MSGNSKKREKNCPDEKKEAEKNLSAFFRRFNPAPLVDPTGALSAYLHRESQSVQEGFHRLRKKRGPGRPSDLSRPNSSANIAQFIESTPGMELRLFTDRKNALWEISHALCGTQEHQRPDRNIAQYIGRHYPMRQEKKRPKPRGPKKDR